MRIILGVPEYPPYHIGGGGPVFEALAQQYVKQGHQVLVIYGYHPTKHGFESIQTYSKDGIDFVQVPLIPTPSFLPFLKTVLPTFPRNISKLRKLITHFQPDVAHLHGYGLIFINQLSLLLSKLTIPYVFTLHGAPVSPQKKGFLVQWLYGLYQKTLGTRILRGAKYLTAVSRYTIDAFAEFATYKEKITVIPNGINSAAFLSKVATNFYEQFVFPGSVKIFLSIGRLEWIKGFEQFISLIPYLVEQGVDVRYCIAGRDNGYKHELEALAHTLSVSDRVIFLDFIQGEEKHSALQYADYIVIPSHTESFGLVALEAMASGVPPIINKVGGLQEIVQHGHNGIVLEFAQQDPKTLVETIRLTTISPENMESSLKKYERVTVAELYLQVLDQHD